MSGPGVQSVDALAVGAPAVLLATLLLVLVLDAAWPGRRGWLDAVSLAGLVVAGGVLVAGARAMPAAGLRTFCVRGPSSQCSYVLSPLSVTVGLLVIALAAACLLLALDGRGADARAPHHVLLLAATTGAVALPATRDLASLLVALETASLPVVALVALRRDRVGAEAALKLLLTAITSVGLLVLGISMLYSATGTIRLGALNDALAAAGDPAQASARVGLLLVVAALAFKVSAVPFHLWTPDTYAGAPVAVAAFLAVVSKAAALAAVVVVLALGLPSLTGTWAPALAALAILTMTIGNLVALRQREAVRLLAWSTVGQAGWVLLPLAGAARGSLNLAAGASVAYLVAYAAATVAAFAVVALVARNVPDGARHQLTEYNGLARTKPAAAVSLAFALACLAGLPPGVMGLFAKLLALRPVVDVGAWLPAVLAAANVALALAYYLPWGARLVSRPAVPGGGGRGLSWRASRPERAVLVAAVTACLLLSVAPGLLASLATAPLH